MTTEIPEVDHNGLRHFTLIAIGEATVHVNPSIDAHGLTGEDFADRDFAEDYHRGTFDVQCYGCQGMRVVLVPDLVAGEHRLAIIEARVRDHHAHLAEAEAERRRGA